MINPLHQILLSQFPSLETKPIYRIGQNKSILYEVFNIDPIFQLFNPEKFFTPHFQKPKPILHGCPINLSSVRMKLFLREYLKDKLFCVVCGLKASHWILEKEKLHDNDPICRNQHGLHLNLFGLSEDQTHIYEVLFTKDHIIPLYFDGPDNITNMQLMCTCCNVKKGSKIESPFQNRLDIPFRIKD